MSGPGLIGRAAIRAAALIMVSAAAYAAIGSSPGQSEDDRKATTRAQATSDSYLEPTISRQLSAPTGSLPRTHPEWRSLVTDPADRDSSLRKRAGLRAYDGAPPVIPHSRSFAQTKTCLDCHETGIQMGKRFGPPISHPHMLNCQQCHVESRNLDLYATAGEVGNSFVGLKAPQGGARATVHAPPVIPHATLMRTDCLSCHGQNGYAGFRTDHPQRTNCMQCHATAAALDQTSPFFTGQADMVIPARSTP